MIEKVLRSGAALMSGAVFGVGLAISGMLNPVRVQGFLDVFGAWDPSLAFVMCGAVVVAFAGLLAVRRMRHPSFGNAFELPATAPIDARLVAGSAIFGAGWGLAGFCPGPAVASLSLGLWQVAAFVVFMIGGMVIHDRIFVKVISRRVGSKREKPAMR